jgi:hypothetical protein
MCECSPLFLLEAKSILIDLLRRTLELFDLSRHLLEYDRLQRFLSNRDEQSVFSHVTLRQTCQLNHQLDSDLDAYLQRLHNSCRIAKTNLRSLHAARITASNDYIVLDDDLYELFGVFKSKLKDLGQEFQWATTKQTEKQVIQRRYQSQRTVHHASDQDSFVFLPETSPSRSMQKNNSSQLPSLPESPSITEDYRSIFVSFHKISQLYRLLIQQLYGVHLVRDTHLLQPIVINIIRLLLLITHQLKARIQLMSPVNVPSTDRVRRHGPCRTLATTESNVLLIESHAEQVEPIQSNYLTVHNDNHHQQSFSTTTKAEEQSLLEFDEDEFYRLANLEHDADP